MVEKKKENRFEVAILVNGKKMVSRQFYTNRYSNDIRRSVDINESMGAICEFIQEEYKRQDLTYIYDKYDLRANDFNKKYATEIKEQYNTKS